MQKLHKKGALKRSIYILKENLIGIYVKSS